MRRKILIAGLSAVLLMVVLVGLLVVFRVNVVKAGASTGVNRATGLTCTVGDVDLPLFASRAGVTGVVVGNEPGFGEPRLARIEKADVDYEFGSLFGDQVVLTRLELRMDDFTVERGPDGMNIRVLADRLSAGEDGAEDEPDADDAKPGKTVMIRELVLNLGTIRLVDRMGDEPKVMELKMGGEDFVFHDVDSSEDVTRLVLNLVLRNAIVQRFVPDWQAIQGAMGEGLGELTGQVNDELNRIGDELMTAGEDLKARASEWFEGLDKGALEDAGRRLGDLIPGRGDDSEED